MTLQARGEELVAPIPVADEHAGVSDTPRKPRRKGFVQGMSLAIALSLALWVLILWIIVRHF